MNFSLSTRELKALQSRRRVAEHLPPRLAEAEGEDVVSEQSKAPPSPAASATSAQSEAQLIDPRVALVSFLEPNDEHEAGDDAGGETRSWLMNNLAAAVNWCAKTFQPEPRLQHCEILVIDSEGLVCHFSTYFSQLAAWQSRDRDYYGTGRWRALVVPTKSDDDVDRIAHMCAQSVGTPYSVSRYLASTRAFSFASGWLRDQVRSPAHCGGLTARILKHAISDDLLHRPPPAYSPSLLYNELKCQSCVPVEVPPSSESPFEYTEDVLDANSVAMNVLLRGTDEEVNALTQLQRARAVKAYANVVLHEHQRPLSTGPQEPALGVAGANVQELVDRVDIEAFRQLYYLAFRASAACDSVR